MKLLGLIGRRISYSFSQKYFTNKFNNENLEDYSYQVFDLEDITQVKKVLELKNLLGFNVTTPYKEKIIPYLDQLSPEAEKIGAVNTVHVHNGKKIGHNTDVIGFANSLKETVSNEQYQSVLILGTGGASKAVQYIINQQQKTYNIVSRKKESQNLLYEELNKENIQNNLLIVNCTPLGTYPNTKECPNIPYQYITNKHICFDLVYNPPQTQFLTNAKANGALIQNGLAMLHGQAEAAWDIWS